jgi:hypothetical protein
VAIVARFSLDGLQVGALLAAIIYEQHADAAFGRLSEPFSRVVKDALEQLETLPSEARRNEIRALSARLLDPLPSDIASWDRARLLQRLDAADSILADAVLAALPPALTLALRRPASDLERQRQAGAAIRNPALRMRLVRQFFVDCDMDTRTSDGADG